MKIDFTHIFIEMKGLAFRIDISYLKKRNQD